ncbi:MAG TPA: hypothetical protein VNT22_01375 [Baekduia sp.]|nr:hypothetical protein [Baekduia sp.]
MRLITDLELPGSWTTPESQPHHQLTIELDASIPETAPGAVLQWSAPIDGSRFSMDRSRDGSFIFRHGTGRHLLSADLKALRCAPVDDEDPAWLRILLDSVLMSVALLAGHEGLHAGSVLIDDQAVAITASAGGGKTTLIHELRNRGHALLADDITILDGRVAGSPLAIPGPPVMTLPDKLTGEAVVLMDLPGERWIAAEVSGAAAPLRTIVNLDRRPGVATMIGPEPDLLGLMLGAFLNLPKTEKRIASRFELASRLASSCQILRITADPSITPAELSSLIESALDRS